MQTLTATPFSPPISAFATGGALATREYDSPASGRRMRELTHEEVQTVSGSVGPVGGLIGAGLGAVGYGWSSAIGGGGSAGGLIAAMAGGAVAGFASPVSAVGVVWGFNGAMVAGIGGGVAQRLYLKHT